MRPDELERGLRQRLDAVAPLPAPNCSTSSCSDIDRVDRIGSYWGTRRLGTFGELLIDCEVDRTLRAVLIWLLRAGDHWTTSGASQLGAGIWPLQAQVAHAVTLCEALDLETEGVPARIATLADKGLRVPKAPYA